MVLLQKVFLKNLTVNNSIDVFPVRRVYLSINTALEIKDFLHVCSFQGTASIPFYKFSGGRLLSHTVSSAVPSAAQALTVVFGMGTGVTPGRIATGNGEYEIRTRDLLLARQALSHLS